MMFFVTYFPGCENIHLVKDVGMIPYKMQRYGYTSLIISYDQDRYTHLGELPGLEMRYLNGRRLRWLDDKPLPNSLVGKAWYWIIEKIVVMKTVYDSLPLMIELARDIDVFQVYHLKYESLAVSILYRLLNPHGMLYLKLDSGEGIKKHLRRPRLHHLLFRLVSYELISTESPDIYEYLKYEHPLFKSYRDRLLLLLNGVDVERLPVPAPWRMRENIILHVARLGYPAKGSDIALTAYALAKTRYKLWLVGEMQPGFQAHYNRFMAAHPELRDRINYLGLIGSRDEMLRIYNRCKILLMPSRSESFGFAGVEALCMGVVLVGSDIPALREMTLNGKHGYLCLNGYAPAFASKLEEITGDEKKMEKTSTKAVRYARKRYGLDDLVWGLAMAINGHRKNRRPLYKDGHGVKQEARS